MVRGDAPASYGDVTGEYLALRQAAGVVTERHDLVWVRGPDAVRFLDGLVSQAVEPMPVGSTARSLLLAPQGKLRAPHVLLRGDDEVGLLTDRGIGEVAANDLTRFKIRVDVSIDIEPAPIVAVWGPEAPVVVGRATGVAVSEGWLRVGDTVAASVPLHPGGLPRVVVAGIDADEMTGAGIRRCGTLAVDSVRIEQGEPVMGRDVGDGTIPQEGLLVEGAVEFTKGCYLGQELVARIDSRGHVNRLLRGVVVAANVIPPSGAHVVHEDKIVGTITSTGESLELRAPVAMALVRREVAPAAGVTLRWDAGQVPARIESLPLDPWSP